MKGVSFLLVVALIVNLAIGAFLVIVMGLGLEDVKELLH